MPAGQPFTSLCQQMGRPRAGDRVDLHIHTTCSDGTYTPQQVVDLARRSGLPALAITDHDTLAGLKPARKAAGSALEVISGVEVTAQFRGREFHLLGYFFREDDGPLCVALEKLRAERQVRYQEMMDYFQERGIEFAPEDLAAKEPEAVLGRRHVAQALVKARRAATERQAFFRFLGDHHDLPVRPVGLPVAEALALVRGAGGVAAWAHPVYDCKEMLLELRGLGLQAVEAEYPGWKRGRRNQLRNWARELGLAITGGSDCHGPGPRSIGHAGITVGELERLRKLAKALG